jgi:hypothetical protein
LRDLLGRLSVRDEVESLTDLNLEQLIVTDSEVEVGGVVLEEVKDHAGHFSHKVDVDEARDVVENEVAQQVPLPQLLC